MTDKFTIDFDFEHADEESISEGDPLVLLGVRYLINGQNILFDEGDHPRYSNDYLPIALSKWLRYVRSVSAGNTVTYEFAEYSSAQLRLIPDGDKVHICVSERHKDFIKSAHVIELDQLAQEIVDATNRYIDWIVERQPTLRSHDSIQELRELSNELSKRIDI